MLAITRGLAIFGIDSYPVDIEANMSSGLPTFSIVGLPDSAVRESKQRVTTAISNLGIRLPGKRITVNMAPAGRKKEGPGFDLPIAVSVLAAAGVVPPQRISRCFMVGELALDGSLRPVRGMLSMADQAGRHEHCGLIVPAANGGEAAISGGQDIFQASSLQQVIDHLLDRKPLARASMNAFHTGGDGARPENFADVRGQEYAKRALEVAAAGGHNILMSGPPGSGKTMLARRLPTILPPLLPEEAVETTKIHSVAGLLGESTSLLDTRPFRAPHHTISDAGLIGGGSVPGPGEVSLAHNGILFLDELPEFRRNVLEVLRQPLEDGRVTIARASMTLTLPARFTLAAAMNPCPCGYLTDPAHSCCCTGPQIQRYLRRISGPLMDRIDIHIDVAPVRYSQLTGCIPSGDSSCEIRQRVVSARMKQARRFEGLPGIHTNADMTSPMVSEFCMPSGRTGELLKRAMSLYGFSARAYHRILKVARTAADLDHSAGVEERHVSEAIQYRLSCSLC